MLNTLVYLLAISAGLGESSVNRKELNGGEKEPPKPDGVGEPVLDALGYQEKSLTIDPDILSGPVVSYADGTPIPGLAESWNLSLSSEPLIVNGKAAEKGKQPYLVSIQVIQDKKAVHLCGGSLVAPNKVLTAAHCLAHVGKLEHKVALGYYQLSLGTKNPGSQLLDVEKATIHSRYRASGISGFPYDIGILTLKEDAKLDSTVQLVELSCFAPWDLVGKTVLLNGWGRSSYNGQSMDILQTAKLKVISKAECQKKWGDMIRAEHFCVSDPTVCACRGDSGSPVMYDGKQVGIVSWGNKVCDPKEPRVFQGVQYHVPFVHQ